MDKLAKLTTDIGKLWETYSGAYFTGIRNTLVLAVVATLIGCVIGLLCGILNTIPYTRQDPPVKRFFLKLLGKVCRRQNHTAFYFIFFCHKYILYDMFYFFSGSYLSYILSCCNAFTCFHAVSESARFYIYSSFFSSPCPAWRLCSKCTSSTEISAGDTPAIRDA